MRWLKNVIKIALPRHEGNILVLVRIYDPSVEDTCFVPLCLENSRTFSLIEVREESAIITSSLENELFNFFYMDWAPGYFVENPTFDVYITVRME